MSRSTALLSVAVLFTAAPAAAEEPLTLAADRPGFSDSTWAVPLGHFAIETGVGFGADIESLDTPLIALPQARIRIGLPGPLEAIINAPSLIYNGATFPGETDFGASDIGFGLKTAFSLADTTAMSLIGTVTAPTATDGFGDDDPTATLGVNVDFGIDDVVTLTAAGFGGYASNAFQFGAGGLVGFSLGDFGVFGQAFVTRSSACEEVVQLNDAFDLTTTTWSFGIGGGVTYMPTSTIQFDLFVDVLPYVKTDNNRRDPANEDLPGNIPGLSLGLGFSFLL